MNAFLSLFEQRIRGVRLIEVIGIVLALGMIFWVCLSKARETEDVRRLNQINQQISDETEAVSSLKIKVAQLERPARLEALAAGYLGMKPVESSHEVRLDSIGEISRATSRPVQVAAPVTPTGVAAPVAPATPVAPAQGDDLISVVAKAPAPPAAAHDSIYSPAPQANVAAPAPKGGR
jgi:cell division protein FtsL